MKSKPKILVVTGSTATGKSDVAVKLAREFGGEVVSADSRQVYRDLDIGTGKITPEEMAGIPHHLLDVADPSERFTVADWKRLAEKEIENITARGKLPVIVGGTGFYISSLMDNVDYPEIETDPDEQKKLESQSAEELFGQLKSLDQKRAEAIDPHNKRRVVRAILIARELGSVPPVIRKTSKYDALILGLTLPDNELKERIRTRLIKRLDAGMIEEVQRLIDSGLSYERLDELGLEYRYAEQFIRGEIKTREELIDILATKIWQYARRQKTWWRKDTRIAWFAPQYLKKMREVVHTWLVDKK